MHEVGIGTDSGFPAFLRMWRKRRRLSQLELALVAGLSQRHLSFLETGRARPSQAAIVDLALALDMPGVELHAMLQAAGYHVQPRHTELDPSERSSIEQSITHILHSHDPFPAMTVNRVWTLQSANASAVRLFDELQAIQEPNLLRQLLLPGPVRSRMVDWAHSARALIRLFEIDVARRPHDAEAQALLNELLGDDQVGDVVARPNSETLAPVLLLRFRVPDRVLALFSLIATVGLSLDSRLDDLRLETMLPADQPTRDWFEHRSACQ